MIRFRPATVEDCRAFPANPEVFPAWEGAWAGDQGLRARMAYAPEVAFDPKMPDLPLAVLGTAVLPRDYTAWPWVWAVLRPPFPGYERVLAGGMKAIRAWLDCHALGHYTVPQVDTPEYVRFLSALGFRPRDDKSRGFWQWRGSLR